MPARLTLGSLIYALYHVSDRVHRMNRNIDGFAPSRPFYWQPEEPSGNVQERPQPATILAQPGSAAGLAE